MARRKIFQSETVRGKFTRVYLDRDWDEYVVEFWTNNVHMDASDYHTDDKSDAIGTAKQIMADEAAAQAIVF